MQRRSSLIQAGASLIVWAAVVCAANACKAPDDPSTTKTTSGNVGGSGSSGGTGVSGGTVDDTAGFNVTLNGDSFGRFTMHDSSDTTTWTTACKVPATATGNATNIFCTVEAPEADLFYRGLHMNYNVPTTMCTYLWVTPYGFYNQLVADGPGNITYWVDKNGVTGIDANNDGTIDGGGQDQVYVNGAVTALAEIVKGKVTCVYDDTPNKGQNCCTGTYGLTVFNWDPSANAGAGAYKPTSTPNVDWGGSPVACYSGPFKDLAEFHTTDGLPESTVYSTDGIGFNRNMDVADPDKKGFASNVYVANYINPADHGVPGVPAAFLFPTTSKPAPTPHPYYDFGCMDSAFEYKARIRVDVRDWNTYTEWSKKGSGNADVTGAESAPYTGSGNNDVADWKDFEVLAPGFAWPYGNL